MSFSRNRYIVYGNVQGVRYRDYVAGNARRFSLTGEVRNMPDGTVEIILEGDTGNLKKFKDFMDEDIKKGEASSDLCLATEIDYELHEEKATSKFQTFKVVYSDSVQEELNEQFAAAMAVQVKMINDMNTNFQSLDTKYHTISQNLGSLPKKIAEEIKKR